MNELTSLDRFESLNKAFSSIESFVNFFKANLAKKELAIWKDEVKDVFNEMSSSTRNQADANDISKRVEIQYQKNGLLKDKISVLQKEVEEDWEKYWEHQHSPLDLFREGMDDAINNLGIDAEEVAAKYRNHLQESLNNLGLIAPFICTAKNVLDRATKDYYDEFHFYLPNNNESAIKQRKFTTAFTVPQLACFFRILYEKSVIETDTKMELFRTISENFITVNSKNGLSENSIKNNFDTLDLKALEYIETIFKNCAAKAKANIDKLKS